MKIMKVKDLMIGDWFHNNYTNENYQVWPTFLSQATNYGKRLNATFEDINITPVPLTDEILKKNEFEYFHKNYASLSYEHPFQLKMNEWPDENGLNGLWTICDIIEIRFVHQLQHALRLCGIDKEIKL